MQSDLTEAAVHHDYSFQLTISERGAMLLVGAGRFIPDRGGSKVDRIFGPSGLRACLARPVPDVSPYEGVAGAAAAANGATSRGAVIERSIKTVEIETFSLTADAIVDSLMLGLVAPQAATMLVEAVVREALINEQLREQIEAYIAAEEGDTALYDYVRLAEQGERELRRMAALAPAARA